MLIALAGRLTFLTQAKPPGYCLLWAHTVPFMKRNSRHMAHPSGRKAAKRLIIFNPRDWSHQLVVLCVFLAVLFVTGGSSRYDVPQLIILRPLAIFVAGYGLATLRPEAWHAYKPVWLMAAAVVGLTFVHLIPLPPQIWQALPGRDIIAEIDARAGLEGVWRPLTLFPEGTWNALYALAVPIAVLLLAAQLSQIDLLRLLIVVLILCAVSGLVGVLQAGGSDLRLYRFGGGASGLFANRNHQAAMLACVFPMLGALTMSWPDIGRQPRAMRLVAGAGVITLIPLLLVTGSRMGLVVATLAFLYLGVVSLRIGAGKQDRAYSSLMLMASGLVLAAVMVLVTTYAARDVAIDRIGRDAEDLRWQFWQTIVTFLPQYLPWGSGIGSFVPVYEIHESADMLMPLYVNQAHNDWLDLVLTSGIPGLFLALVAMVMLAKAAGVALIAQGIPGHLRRAGIGMILVLALASLSDYPVRTPILSAFVAIAVIWASAPLYGSNRNESTKPHAKA